MKFIDLYAGIGGFRYALESFGNECVFSAEIEKNAIEVYKDNFKDDSAFDMNRIANMTDEEIEKMIPDHEMLAGGFPCQPFSHGGKKRGFSDARGTQFFNILRILEVKKPRFIFLENVQNITTHDNGNTFKFIRESLNKLGYSIPEKPIIISPENLGIPQRRKRAFFFAEKNMGESIIAVPEIKNKKISTIVKGIDFPPENLLVDKDLLKAIYAWEEFVAIFESDVVIPILWFDYMISSEFDERWGKNKKEYIIKMRNFYHAHKTDIDKWIKKHRPQDFPILKYRKLEYISNSDKNRTFRNKILTIRQSGVRISRGSVFPTLVAMAEIPMIFDEKFGDFRRISSKEMSKLQSFPAKFKPSQNDKIAAKHFGNSVNVDVIKYIYSQGVK